jgi:hypothetical protein
MPLLTRGSEASTGELRFSKAIAGPFSDTRILIQRRFPIPALYYPLHMTDLTLGI